MNIFFLHTNTIPAARYHCDKHVVKMILETAQILCTVAAESGLSAPYRPTHRNHPSVVWAKDNSEWLYNLGLALGIEYSWRYFKEHKSIEVIKAVGETLGLKDIAGGACLGSYKPPYPLAISQACKDDLGLGNTTDSVRELVKAYRYYYIKDKHGIATWKNRGRPLWWQTQST